MSTQRADAPSNGRGSARVVVVGAGISGLAAARAAVETARDAGIPLDVVVLERDSEVGGKAKTVRRDGWLVESGPTGYLDAADVAPLMRHLMQVAAVEASVVQASKEAALRYIARKGRARRVFADPFRMAWSGLMSPLGIARIAAEPFIAAKRDDDDESVFNFAARRIGREAAERLIAPMMLGVFAGDARKLSLPAALPRLRELERDHGSLVRGMLARRRKKPDESGSASGPAGTLTSLRDGLQSLARGLARYGGFRVIENATVEGIARSGPRGWRVQVAGASEAVEADALVLAGEAWSTAALLREHAPRAAETLSAINCPPVAVVALGYRGTRSDVHIPRGFGVLVPRGESIRMLGCLWDSQIFDGRAPANSVLVRAMLGGAVDPEAGALSDADAVACVREDMGRLLGVDAIPCFRHVVRWPAAIPQYELGHEKRVALVERETALLPSLFVAGNALHGVAFAKAATSGWTRGSEAARVALAGAAADVSTPTGASA